MHPPAPAAEYTAVQLHDGAEGAPPSEFDHEPDTAAAAPSSLCPRTCLCQFFLLALLLACTLVGSFFGAFHGYSRSLRSSPSSASDGPLLPLSSAALSCPARPFGMRVSVVYNVFLNDVRPWWKLYRLQLTDLVDCGLAAESDVHVAISAPAVSVFDASTERAMDLAEAIGREVIPHARFYRFAGNRFEYPGIKLLWELAQAETDGAPRVTPDSGSATVAPTQLPYPSASASSGDGRKHALLYFHSKGMVNHGDGSARDWWNQRLTNTVVLPWRKAVQRFATDEAVNKAGFAAAIRGWIWYNFMWARASYLRTVVKPILTSRRHYYGRTTQTQQPLNHDKERKMGEEDWIGRLAEPNSPIPDYKIAANRTYELGRWSEGADSLSMCPGNKEDKLNYLVQPESMSLCD